MMFQILKVLSFILIFATTILADSSPCDEEDVSITDTFILRFIYLLNKNLN